MKVYHIQFGMTPAGNAPYRLHEAMLRSGIDSNIITLESIKKFYKVTILKRDFKSIITKIFNTLNLKIKLRNKKSNTYLFNILSTIGNKQVFRIAKDADVIYIHWIGGYFLSWGDLAKIAMTGIPIIFYLHDMWTFTGGCHHSFACKKYIDGCKNCEMFYHHDKIAEKQAFLKHSFFQKFKNIYIVTPSKWEESCAKQSFILNGLNIRCIPNLVDESVFKPVNKNTCREILNLPQNKFIISFGCQAGTKNQAKGWKYLKEAINKLNINDIHLVIFGSDYDKETADELNYPITFLGQRFDESSLVLIANAADLHVSPSLAESFGMTFVEYSLCNTPVIGFDCTAVPESVIPNINGYLAKYKDSEDLANCILKAYNEKMIVKYRSTYSSKEILKRHIDLLNEII